MPSNFELHILRVQGISADLSIVGCYVSLEGRLYDVITPLGNQTPDCVVLLPSSGLLKLMIKKMSSGDDQVIGSVSFSISLFPSVGGQFWVPLFESYEEDVITSLTQEAPGPKLLLKVSMPSGLPPVNEITENSIEDSSVEQISLARAEDDTNLSRVTFGDINESQGDPLKDERTETKAAGTMFQSSIIEDLRLQIEGLQQMVHLEKTQREAQESKLKTVFAEYEAAQKRMMIREKALTGHLLEKDKELFKSIEENTELKIKARLTESEMYQLQEKLKMMETQSTSASISSASEALDFALEQLRESEVRRRELQSHVLKSGERLDESEDIVNPQVEALTNKIAEMSTQISSLQSERDEFRVKEQRANQEIARLTHQLGQAQHEAESARFSLRPTETRLEVDVMEGLSSRTTPTGANSMVDHLLDEYFEERGMQNPFTKVAENAYMLENKKFAIAIKNGTLVAKVGSGFVYIEEILKLSGKRSDTSLQQRPYTWSAPRLISGGRSTSAGRERAHNDDKEPVETARGGGHKKVESEVPAAFTKREDRPGSPKKQVGSSMLFRPVKESVTPLKERYSAKKAGIASAEKGRKPFR